MNIKSVLFLLISTITNQAFATLTKVDGVSLCNNKKITFLADNHNASPHEEQQTKAIVDFFKENEASTSKVFVEQASKLFASSPHRITFKLNENIKKASPNNVVVKNIEVRYPAIIAYALLNSNNLQSYEDQNDYVIDNNNINLGQLNFQHVLDTFDNVKQKLSDYYEKHDDKRIGETYKRHIRFADQDYDKFKQTTQKLHKKHASILAYAKHKHSKCSGKRGHVAQRIHHMFNPLLDLNILKNILKSKLDNLIVVAGINHTRDVLSMLYPLQVTPLYRSLEHKYTDPCTADEIRQGLTSKLPVQQPSWTTTGINYAYGAMNSLYNSYLSYGKPQSQT